MTMTTLNSPVKKYEYFKDTEVIIILDTNGHLHRSTDEGRSFDFVPGVSGIKFNDFITHPYKNNIVTSFLTQGFLYNFKQ